MTAEQIPLLPAGRRVRRTPARAAAADRLPVASVALMLPVPHLDRPFDYEVPATLDAVARPGVRVRVRFSGRLVDGFLLDRVAESDRDLAPIRSVLGPPVLTPEVLALCRAVADRWAGTLADVLRFAVPARHARVEAEFAGAEVEPGTSRVPAAQGLPQAGAQSASVESAAAAGEAGLAPIDPYGRGWADYGGGGQLIAGFGGPHAVRAVWTCGPGERTAERLAEVVAAVQARGRGIVVVVPDAVALDRVVTALDRAGVPSARLMAEAGPQARYRTFLSVLTGGDRIVVGTRAAVFAPVVDLGAIIVWDDADESLAEPQAPGWHAREVAAMRAAECGASLLVAGTAASLEGARMVQSGWMSRVALPREVLRARMPRVQAAADLAARDPATAGDRIPAVALAVLRQGLELGHVLVGVPRRGYLPLLACQRCRETARCPTCSSPLRADGPQRVPTCATHGALHGWRCGICGTDVVRAAVVGVDRTAEEFGRALPGTTVLAASGEHPVRALPARRSLVVATPGSHPDPGPDGYAALVLLDTSAALSRPGLRVAEEVLRRWFDAAALVRPATQGGRVLVVGEPEVREVQALIRWDPWGYAERELADRRTLHLPPAVRVAQLSGPAQATGELADGLARELGSRALRIAGPLPGSGDDVTWLVAASLADGALLAGALRREQAARSARRAPVVTSRIDPIRLR